MAKRTTIASTADRVLIVPDIHFPNHDPHALDCLKQACEIIKPDEVVLLGDVVDCATFSTHVKSRIEQKAQDFRESELSPATDLLEFFARFADKIVYLEGNHEYREARKELKEGGE